MKAVRHARNSASLLVRSERKRSVSELGCTARSACNSERWIRNEKGCGATSALACAQAPQTGATGEPRVRTGAAASPLPCHEVAMETDFPSRGSNFPRAPSFHSKASFDDRRSLEVPHPELHPPAALASHAPSGSIKPPPVASGSVGRRSGCRTLRCTLPSHGGGRNPPQFGGRCTRGG